MAESEERLSSKQGDTPGSTQFNIFERGRDKTDASMRVAPRVERVNP